MLVIMHLHIISHTIHRKLFAVQYGIVLIKEIHFYFVVTKLYETFLYRILCKVQNVNFDKILHLKFQALIYR